MLLLLLWQATGLLIMLRLITCLSWLTSLFTSLPPSDDWDIVMLGHYCHTCPLVAGAPRYRHAHSFFGTHSYIVHRRGLQKVFAYPHLMPIEKQIDAGGCGAGVGAGWAWQLPAVLSRHQCRVTGIVPALMCGCHLGRRFAVVLHLSFVNAAQQCAALWGRWAAVPFLPALPHLTACLSCLCRSAG